MKDTPFTEARLLSLYDRVAEAEDAIPRLRRFVLDLAVRGKLVPQDAGDEPASVLLERIEKERARLVKAKLISPPKPLPRPGRNDRVFDGPPHWEPVNMASVLDELQTGPFGSALHQSDYVVGGTPVINPASIQNGKIVPADRMAVGPKTIERLTGFQLRGGDIVMARRGEMGRCALVTEREAGWLCGTGSLVLRLSRYLHGEFMVLLIGSPTSREYLGGSAVGATMQNLNQAILLQLPFGLPPLAEQHRIVAKVEELMALLDRLEAARAAREETRTRLTAATLSRLTEADTDTPTAARFPLQTLPALTTRPDQIKTLRQTILNLAVRGKLVEQDAEDEPVVGYLLGLSLLPAKTRRELRPLDPQACGGDLPRGWAWLPLGSLIGSMDAGWSPQCENHARANESEWAVLKTTAVQALSFDSSQNKRLPDKLQARPQYQAEIGDILVTRAGPKNRVGVSCVVDVACPRLMISDKLIRFHTLGDLSPDFVALTLNAGYTFQQLEAAKSGMAVMQMNISQDKLRAIPIPLPPLAEQHRIVAKVQELMSLCDRLERALQDATTTRTRLLDATLREALTGAQEAA